MTINCGNTPIYYLLAFFRVVFTKYLKAKYGEQVNVNKQIIKIYEQGKKEIMLKTFDFVHQFLKKLIGELPLNLSQYQEIKDKLARLHINPNDIETIVLNNNNAAI